MQVFKVILSLNFCQELPACSVLTSVPCNIQVKWSPDIVQDQQLNPSTLGLDNKHLKHDRVADKVKSTAVFWSVSTQNISKIVITLLLIVSGKEVWRFTWLK